MFLLICCFVFCLHLTACSLQLFKAWFHIETRQRKLFITTQKITFCYLSHYRALRKKIHFFCYISILTQHTMKVFCFYSTYRKKKPNERNDIKILYYKPFYKEIESRCPINIPNISKKLLDILFVHM